MPRSASQVASAIRPPGTTTRASSRATAAWSGANITPNVEVTVSNDASGYGSASQSPTCNSTATPCSAACRLAVSISAGARSSPVTAAPARAARSAIAPVPHATSSQRSPARTPSRSVLGMPVNSSMNRLRMR